MMRLKVFDMPGCWEWRISPGCNSMLFGDCPECGDITSAVMDSDFVGMTEMSCQRINDVARRELDGCGWRCQISVDVPKRKAYFVREVCTREM